MIKKVIPILLAIAALAVLVAAITRLLYGAPLPQEAASNPFPTRPANCVPFPTPYPTYEHTPSATPLIRKVDLSGKTAVPGGLEPTKAATPTPTKPINYELTRTLMPTQTPVRFATVDLTRVSRLVRVALPVRLNTGTPFPTQAPSLIQGLRREIIFNLEPDVPDVHKFAIIIYRCNGAQVVFWARAVEGVYAEIPLEEGDTIVYITHLSNLFQVVATPDFLILQTYRPTTTPFLPYPPSLYHDLFTPTPWVYPPPSNRIPTPYPAP